MLYNKRSHAPGWVSSRVGQQMQCESSWGSEAKIDTFNIFSSTWLQKINFFILICLSKMCCSKCQLEMSDQNTTCDLTCSRPCWEIPYLCFCRHYLLKKITNIILKIIIYWSWAIYTMMLCLGQGEKDKWRRNPLHLNLCWISLSYLFNKSPV